MRRLFVIAVAGGLMAPTFAPLPAHVGFFCDTTLEICESAKNLPLHEAFCLKLALDLCNEEKSQTG